MNRTRINLFLASLAVSAAINAGVANAMDHRLWREQIARPVDSVTVLESKPADPEKKYGNDSLLWREQVKISSKNRVFILEHAPQRRTKSGDSRLWREQIRSKPSVSELRTTSDSRRTDKVQDQ